MKRGRDERLLWEIEEWDGQSASFMIPPPRLTEQIVASPLLLPDHETLCLALCLTRVQQGPTSPSVGSSPSKKDAASLPQTPLEKLLSNAGPIREDGSDKFFGMENVCLPIRRHWNS
jgi:hypothetical protein